MTEIRQLIKHIEEALEHKSKDPTISELYHTFSVEETDAMRQLHNAVERLINGYRRLKGESPAAMVALYDQRSIFHIKKDTSKLGDVFHCRNDTNKSLWGKTGWHCLPFRLPPFRF